MKKVMQKDALLEAMGQEAADKVWRNPEEVERRFLEMKDRLARNMKLLMKTKGLQQEDLARIVDVSTSAVSTWMRGEKVPRLDKLIILCTLFEVDIRELFDPELSRSLMMKQQLSHQEEKEELQREEYITGTDAFRTGSAIHDIRSMGSGGSLQPFSEEDTSTVYLSRQDSETVSKMMDASAGLIVNTKDELKRVTETLSQNRLVLLLGIAKLMQADQEIEK